MIWLSTTYRTWCNSYHSWSISDNWHYVSIRYALTVTRAIYHQTIEKLRYILQHAGTPDLDNASLRPALIAVSCLLVVVSVLMLIIGLICGHCLSQRWRKLTQHKQSMSTNHTTEQMEDLELKENVAYVTFHPK